MSEDFGTEPIYVRATVNLQGLGRDRTAWVDPKLPYMQGLLRAKWLVPVEPWLYVVTGEEHDKDVEGDESVDERPVGQGDASSSIG